MSYTNPIYNNIVSVPSNPQTNPPTATSETFLSNISSTGYAINKAAPDMTAAANGILQEAGGIQSKVDSFFSSYVSPITQFNNLPSAWDAFTQQFMSSTGSSSASTSTTSPLFQGLFNTYLSSMGLSTTNGGDPITGDGSVLAGFNPPVTVAQLQTQFKNAMSFFLMNYSNLFPSFGGTTSNAPTLGTEQQFLANLQSFMTQTAVLQSSTGGGLPSYQQVWDAFGLPDSGFTAALQQFYNTNLLNTGNGNAANGYFIPSQSMSAWMQYAAQQVVNTKSVTSVPSGSGASVVVINKILYLLVQLIGTLQSISASQAGYLNFLVKWQSAYNALLAQIPSFTQGDGTELGGKQSDSSDLQNKKNTVRNNINPKMQALQTIVTSRRDSISDQAKAMQSLINQSQTNSNSAVDMATAFLTELDTILQSIFKR